MNRTDTVGVTESVFNPLNAELNPICHLLALLGGATIVVVSRLRVNSKCKAVSQSVEEYYMHSLSPNDEDRSVSQVFPLSNTVFRN